MILLILFALFIGSLIGALTVALFASRSYEKGWTDCETYQRRHYLRIIDRLASARRDNIARVIGTMAPCPESEELIAERERRG